jgi:hypothetical protein
VTVTNPTASGSTAKGPGDPSVKGTTVELKDLVVAYAKQETLDPLKALGRFLLWGGIGAVLLAVGTVIGSITVVRAIQTETAPHLTGDWSWVPYTGGVLFALAMAGLAAAKIARDR